MKEPELIGYVRQRATYEWEYPVYDIDLEDAGKDTLEDFVELEEFFYKGRDEVHQMGTQVAFEVEIVT